MGRSMLRTERDRPVVAGDGRVEMAEGLQRIPLVEAGDGRLGIEGNRRAMLLEVKRGNGATELRKIRPITEALNAGSLQIKAHLKALGYRVRSVDAKLVDYYGHSGFDDQVRITGADLDRTFQAPVRGLIEAVLAEMRARLFAALPALLAQAMAEAAQGPEREPRLVSLSGGVKVAPEHVRQIELPPRRRGKAKIVEVIHLKGPRRPTGSAPAVVQ